MRDDEIVDKIERDPVIAKALTVRFHQAAGREVYLTGRNRSARALKPYCDEILDFIENFEDSRLILARYGALTGMRWAKMAGEYIETRIGDDLVPRKWWVPRFLVDIDKRRLRLESKVEKATDGNGAVQDRLRIQWVMASAIKPAEEYVVTHPEHYIRYSFVAEEMTRGYGRGMLESLMFYARAKTKIFAYLVAGLERFGYPWIHAAISSANIDATIGTVDQFATRQARIDALMSTLQRMRQAQVFVTAPEDKVTALDLGAAGNVMMLNALGYIDKAMVERILGSSMPTGGGEQGSFARARVEEETTNTVVEFERLKLGRTLTRDLIGSIVRYNEHNFRDMGLAVSSLPELRIGRELGNDYMLNMKRLEFLRNNGLPTNAADWYSFVGVSMPDDAGVEVPDIVPGLPPGMAAPAPAMGSSAPSQFSEGGELSITDSMGRTIWRGKEAA